VKSKGWSLLACLLLAAPPALAQDETGLTDLVAVIHLHSTFSDGAASPAVMARAARAAGVDAIVLTDHLLQRVRYAPWPLGNVMGVAVSRPSVLSHGVARYLTALARAEGEAPGTLVLPGVETSPYSRFGGSPLAGSLELQGWHRHLLVLGIDDSAGLALLPAAGNRAAWIYGPWSLLYLLPAAALAWSARRLARPGYEEARLGAFRLRQRRRHLGAILIGIAALAALVAGFPFRIERYSPVGPDPGAAPFQAMIDAVRARGGITVWAHPEARAEDTLQGVHLFTAPYPALVRETDADGFAALPEGVKELLPPGGIWDQALSDFVAGRRAHPPRAIAELDEHHAPPAVDFGILQTVFQVRQSTHAGILEALRAGRLYARWTPSGAPPLRLLSFSLAARGRSAGAGGALPLPSGPLSVRFAVGGGGGAVTARLVRGGAVIWTRRVVPPFSAEVEDDPGGATFYRLDLEGAYPYRLIANPIFVAARQEAA